ncbi:hypothetical protein ACWC24_06095 [Streptomyces sp. NPDC001443]
MNTAIYIVAVIVAVLMGAAGIAGAATGWVSPWGSGILRPRLMGWATLLAAVGFSLFIFLGPLGGSHGPLPWIGWAAFMIGLFLQSRARRPDIIPFGNWRRS